MQSRQNESVRTGRKSLLCGVSVLIAVGYALLAGGTENTPHNMLPGDGGGQIDLCAFCHTPVGSRSGMPKPDWRRAAPLPKDNSAYASIGPNEAGSYTNKNIVGSVSLVCLSCHDPHGAGPMLLRVENSYGRLCTSCHSL